MTDEAVFTLFTLLLCEGWGWRACIRGATEGRRGGAKMLSKPYQARRHMQATVTHTQICTQICIHACMPQWYIIWVCHRCWNNTPRYTSGSICMCADLSLLTTKSGSRVWALFWVDSGNQGKLIGYNEAMDRQTSTLREFGCQIYAFI